MTFFSRHKSFRSWHHKGKRFKKIRKKNLSYIYMILRSLKLCSKKRNKDIYYKENLLHYWLEDLDNNMKEESEQKECHSDHALKSLMQGFVSVMGIEDIFKPLAICLNKTNSTWFYRVILWVFMANSHAQLSTYEYCCLDKKRAINLILPDTSWTLFQSRNLFTRTSLRCWINGA